MSPRVPINHGHSVKYEDVEAKELVKIEGKQENSWKSTPTELATSVFCVQPLI